MSGAPVVAAASGIGQNVLKVFKGLKDFKVVWATSLAVATTGIF